MYDSSKTIQEFLDAAGAKQPIPGGGSVTALVGALAASMGEMVVNYSVGKKGLENLAEHHRTALAELHRARQLLQQLMVEDQLAYQALTEARKLPADSKERAEKLPAALVACVRAPQAMAATGVAILNLCGKLVETVNPWLLSDLAVCAELAMATVRCATYNVRINLSSLDDPKDRESLDKSCSQMLQHALIAILQVSPQIWSRADKVK